MEDNNQEHHDEIPNKNIKNETLEIKSEEQKSISNFNNELKENKDSQINLIENSNDKENNKIVEEKSKDNKDINLNPNSNKIIDKITTNTQKSKNELTKENTTENNKFNVPQLNSDKYINKSSENVDKGNKEIAKEEKSNDNKKVELMPKSDTKIEKIRKNPQEINKEIPVKAKVKPVKEPPIEKKPFLEFVNEYLIPEIKNEFKLKGKDVNKIYLQKTHRPIAEDICWVIYCEINDTCNFWLSFERDDITSLKSFSLCKNYEKPSIIESFLIDEKKITLKLIISRILQRLNGQKLIGAN